MKLSQSRSKFFTLQGKVLCKSPGNSPLTRQRRMWPLSMKIIRFAVKNESKLILASSSEMYPRQVSVVSESDPIKASSPYGVSKATAFELAQLLRNEGRLLVSNLIMFNHESPLRKKQFLTKKLTDQLLQVADGVRTNISVWDKSASKDFSWAADFIRPMVSKTMMDLNDDFVLASGKSTTVEELALAGLRLIGLSVPVLEERDAAITAAPNPTGNPSKAEKLLGFRKTQDGAEVMRKLIELELKTSGLIASRGCKNCGEGNCRRSAYLRASEAGICVESLST